MWKELTSFFEVLNIVESWTLLVTKALIFLNDAITVIGTVEKNTLGLVKMKKHRICILQYIIFRANIQKNEKWEESVAIYISTGIQIKYLST